jgi:hypothetical protein
MREETLFEKAAISIMFLAVLVLMVWVPDFELDEKECAKQDVSAYVKRLCDESKAK